MPLDAIDGAKALQLITARYNSREWRKKIEKTLSLPPSGMADDVQRKIFLYLKINLQAYKSRRADPSSWIVGGFATKEVIERARFNPSVVDSSLNQEHVALLGVDPGEEVDQVWWEDMLVKWFERPEEDEEDIDGEEGQVSEDVKEETSQDNGPPETSTEQVLGKARTE